MSAAVSIAAVTRLMTISLFGSALVVFPLAAGAGVHPQVDLSVQVTTAPVPFVRGERGTVSLTLHNAGPDSAGTTYPGTYAIDVIQSGFIITTHPPPYEIRGPVDGCFIAETITEPLPNGDIALVWEFYFDVGAPNASRTYTFGIKFYSSTQDSFPTSWIAVSPNDDDTNPDNDRVQYTFLAPPVSIPEASSRGLAALVVGLIVIGLSARRNRYDIAYPSTRQ